jgi:hypothetical protein
MCSPSSREQDRNGDHYGNSPDITSSGDYRSDVLPYATFTVDFNPVYAKGIRAWAGMLTSWRQHEKSSDSPIMPS